jgi:hypothetical protein
LKPAILILARPLTADLKQAWDLRPTAVHNEKQSCAHTAWSTCGWA